MNDVVLRFAVGLGEEAQRFAAYFQTFVDRAFIEAMLSDGESPLVILRSLPGDGQEVKELVFQSALDAQAFANGWMSMSGG